MSDHYPFLQAPDAVREEDADISRRATRIPIPNPPPPQWMRSGVGGRINLHYVKYLDVIGIGDNYSIQAALIDGPYIVVASGFTSRTQAADWLDEQFRPLPNRRPRNEMWEVPDYFSQREWLRNQLQSQLQAPPAGWPIPADMRTGEEAENDRP